MKDLIKKKNFYYAIAIFVFILFAYITYKTPLAGDDWGYAINGTKGNPIEMAISFYYSWSGRFFSELWGMIVPNNKWLWNIINPLLFFGIFLGIYKLGYIKNKLISVPLFMLAFMLSVNDNLRMETYSWIMGTTYVIPLFLSLLYFLVIDQLFSKNLYSTKLKVFAYLDNLLLIIIGLMMENIAATMIVGITVAMIYGYFVKRKTIKYLFVNLIVAIVAFVIMRLSPGSASRLAGQNVTWVNMNIFEKIAETYPTFINMSFIKNKYAISLFSLVLVFLTIFSKKDISLTYKIISIVVSLIGVINVFSFVIGNSFLNDYESIYSFIFWPIYIVNSFITIYIGLDDTYRRDKTLFLLMIGGCSVLVMLFSPIFGARSSLYLVYYLLVVSIAILEELNINKKCLIGLFVITVLIIGDRTVEFVSKYKLVGEAYEERMQIIEYYKNNPDIEEAWIPRFPIYTIHGADIEEGDTYHFETFKEYYGLPQDANKIIFYYKGS